jgi:hypothetical protein
MITPPCAAAVRGAEAVGELRLDRQRQARAAFAELIGLDLEVLQEGNALLVVAREFKRVHRAVPGSSAFFI